MPAPLKQLATKIPAEYRKEILLTNMINNAVAVPTDVNMHYLFTVWKNYIEPDVKGDCNACFGRVLNNYKAIQETFIELEKESNLLNSFDGNEENNISIEY